MFYLLHIVPPYLCQINIYKNTGTLLRLGFFLYYQPTTNCGAKQFILPKLHYKDILDKHKQILTAEDQEFAAIATPVAIITPPAVLFSRLTDRGLAKNCLARLAI